MKRRFTFIDILPPARDLHDQELAIAVYHALTRLGAQGMLDSVVDAEQGSALWEDVVRYAWRHTADRTIWTIWPPSPIIC